MIYFFSLKDKYLSAADSKDPKKPRLLVSVRAGDKFKKIEYSKKGKVSS